jgi:threonine/homoserine/homoserine lactone efflux protein
MFAAAISKCRVVHQEFECASSIARRYRPGTKRFQAKWVHFATRKSRQVNEIEHDPAERDSNVPMDGVIALLTAATALMGSPGPATLSSAAAGAAYRLRAVPYVIGISLGTMTVIVLVAAGVTGLVTSIPGAAPVISVLAGGYILYLAYRIATAPPVGALDHQAMAPPLIGGYALAIANPKAYGAMGALFSGFPIVQDDPVAGGILKVVILSVFALAVNTTWMSVGAGLARAMQNPRTSRMLNVTFSLLLVASVVAAFLL